MLSINRNDYHSGKKSAFRVMARMILCLMLTFALALPMAVPENVYAASTLTEEEANALYTVVTE